MDLVYHLAASLPQAKLTGEAFQQINVGGTANVLDGCVKYGVKRIVYASTIELYG